MFLVAWGELVEKRVWLKGCLRVVERVQGRGAGILQGRGRKGLFESFCTFPKPVQSLLKLNQIQFIKKNKLLLTNTNLGIGIIGLGGVFL